MATVNLTQEQKDILAHVVENPQAWADHAGEEAMLAKVEKYHQAYLDTKASMGKDYTTRKQREDVFTADFNDRIANPPYDEARVRAYGDIGDQLDMIYKDIDAWRDHVAKVKSDIPKE